MDDVSSVCAALTRLGFSAKSDGFITDDQGLDTFDELKVVTNDEIESLFKVVRRPRETAPNPNSGDPGQPAQLAKPGEEVPLRAELNLKLACYYLHFKDRTSCVVQSPKISLVNVCELQNHRDWEKLPQGCGCPGAESPGLVSQHRNH